MINLPLLQSVKVFYVAQGMRLRLQGMLNAEKLPQGVILAKDHLQWLRGEFELYKQKEKTYLQRIESFVERDPVYTEWLKDVDGIGPTMAGVLLGYLDFEIAKTPSSVWRYSGLHVESNNKAPRPVQGKKLTWNYWFRTRLLGVIARSFLLYNENYRKIYENQKHRRNSMRVPCMRCDQDENYRDSCRKCNGSGHISIKVCDNCGNTNGFRYNICIVCETKIEPQKETCSICNGTGKVSCLNCHGELIGPWGKSDLHRHRDAIRKMLKIFLIDLWTNARRIKGLPTRPTYQEEYLGHIHQPENLMSEQVIMATDFSPSMLKQ